MENSERERGGVTVNCMLKHSQRGSLKLTISFLSGLFNHVPMEGRN